MRRLVIVDVGIGDDGVLIIVDDNLPQPVAHAGGVVHDGSGVGAGVAVLLVDIVHAVGDDGELVALDVAQDGAVAVVDAVVDINDVEVEPVGHLVVRVTGGVGEVDLVLAVALVLGIGACARALHNLLGTEVERAVVRGVRHCQSGDGRVPVDAAPAEVDVVGVVRQDEGRGVGGVVGRCQVFLVAQVRDVTRLS